MQTMFLNNYSRRFFKINTVLRTNSAAFFAAVAALCNNIAGCGDFFIPNRKRKALDRLFGKVKPFALALVKTENRQRLTGLLGRIDFKHIRILIKQSVEPFGSDLLDLAPNGYGNAGHGVAAFHSGQSNISICKFVIKFLDI